MLPKPAASGLDRAEVELGIEPLETAFDLGEEREVHVRYASSACRSDAT